MSFPLRLLFRAPCLFLPATADSLYVLLLAAASRPRLRFEVGPTGALPPPRPYAEPSFWPLFGQVLDLGVAPLPAVAEGAPIAAAARADLGLLSLPEESLEPRLERLPPGLDARLRVPKGNLGAWSSAAWERLGAGYLFLGAPEGGCAFLLADCGLDRIVLELPDGAPPTVLRPAAGQALELAIEPEVDAGAAFRAERWSAAVETY